LRREEKLREAEDAKRLKEQKAKEHEEFLAQKAVRDAKKKAAEDAEAAALAEAAAARKAEREARKREKLAQKAAAQEAARLAAEQAVLADVWTQDQQLRFESALLEHTALTDKYDRWSAIARAVGDKTMNQCIMRYRYLKEYVLKRKEIEASAIA
jgi:nuclear receptor co-repressor 2